jgi:hypothetical protein
MTTAGHATGVRVADVKNKPLDWLLGLIDAARQTGVPYLDVMNRGRPILHLGLADDLPERWRHIEPSSLPLTDLKRSRISLVALKRERRPFLLTRRSGPPLAVWPIEEGYARPSELAASERLDYQDRQIRRLRRDNDRLEHRLSRLERTLRATSTVWSRSLGEEATDESEPEGEGGDEDLDQEQADASDEDSPT